LTVIDFIFPLPALRASATGLLPVSPSYTRDRVQHLTPARRLHSGRLSLASKEQFLHARFCPLVSYCGNDSLVSAGQYYDDNGFLQAQPVERGPDQARFIPSKA